MIHKLEAFADLASNGEIPSFILSERDVLEGIQPIGPLLGSRKLLQSSSYRWRL